jgi:hypothetical protein
MRTIGTGDIIYTIMKDGLEFETFILAKLLGFIFREHLCTYLVKNYYLPYACNSGEINLITCMLYV